MTDRRGTGRLVVVGAGDVGGQVARRWVAAGGAALGITATPRRHRELRGWGVEPSTADPGEVIRPEDRVLLSISGSGSQGEMARHLEGIGCRRAVMTGTTGILGSPRGRVDESTPTGEGEGPARAAEAEEAFRRWVPGGVVLRLGGLYREGRGPLQPLLQRGAPRPGPPDRTLALIHRDDAVTAALAALGHPHPAPVYLAVTPPLPTREEFYRAACALHGLPEPAFGEPVGAPLAVWDVGLLRRDLLPVPAHPDWREAIRG